MKIKVTQAYGYIPSHAEVLLRQVGATILSTGALAGGAYMLMSPAKQASKRAAGSVGRRLTAYSQNPRRHRNVQEGFYRDGVFHPIRASSDYSAVRAGEALPPRRPTKKKKGWRY